MKLCPPKPEATGVVFHCGDIYTEHLSLEDLSHPRTLLVTQMDGTILPGTDHPLDLGKTPHRISGGEITY
jgi:DMSO/TMAO reductase YedYZ molybdopterin-dependent catalytic subunit